MRQFRAFRARVPPLVPSVLFSCWQRWVLWVSWTEAGAADRGHVATAGTSWADSSSVVSAGVPSTSSTEIRWAAAVVTLAVRLPVEHAAPHSPRGRRASAEPARRTDSPRRGSDRVDPEASPRARRGRWARPERASPRGRTEAARQPSGGRSRYGILDPTGDEDPRGGGAGSEAPINRPALARDGFMHGARHRRNGARWPSRDASVARLAIRDRGAARWRSPRRPRHWSDIACLADSVTVRWKASRSASRRGVGALSVSRTGDTPGGIRTPPSLRN